MSLVGSTVCTVQRRLVLHSEVHYEFHHPTLALSSQERAKNSIAKFFDRVRKVFESFLLFKTNRYWRSQSTQGEEEKSYWTNILLVNTIWNHISKHEHM